MAKHRAPRVLPRHGLSVTWQGRYAQVFMFAEEEYAEVFRKEFGGERMHPSEKGTGKDWATLARKLQEHMIFSTEERRCR
jgi:hypothetical protein